MKGTIMNVKKDLADIGYLLITPFPRKYRFEGVNYKRASIQLTIGALALQFGTIAAITFGPIVIDKVRDLKDNVTYKRTTPKK